METDVVSDILLLVHSGEGMVIRIDVSRPE